jgi:hypothetical protein
LEACCYDEEPAAKFPTAAARSVSFMKATDRERKRLKDFVQRILFKTAR